MSIQRYPETVRRFLLSDGSAVEPEYGPKCAGTFPYTRGIHPDMYRGKLWTMRQYAGCGDAAQTNERLRLLLHQGQTGLSLAFDLPTQLGYDADHPLAFGEVGKAGLSVTSLADLDRALQGIPLNQISLSMTINAPAIVLLAMIVVLAERRGIEQGELTGTIQNDILKEYTARGAYLFPPEPSLRLSAELVAYCAAHMPRWRPMSVSGYHMREAGCTAAQEIAFTFTHAFTYIEAAKRLGVPAIDTLSTLSFFFAVHSHFFEEIAKFRAARRLWATLVTERYQATPSSPAAQLRFHAQTGGVTLTAQQCDNNMTRVALQALSAIFGGTQSLHTNAKDEALHLPSETNALSALRIQQVLAFETGVADTVDPLAGSYYTEALTDKLEADALYWIREAERRLKMEDRIQWMRGIIANQALEDFKRIELGDKPIVGINCFTEGSTESGMTNEPSTLKLKSAMPNPSIRNRNLREIHAALQELRLAASSGTSLMPSIKKAVKLETTIGEICGVLREVFGEYEPSEEWGQDADPFDTCLDWETWFGRS